MTHKKKKKTATIQYHKLRGDDKATTEDQKD